MRLFWLSTTTVAPTGFWLGGDLSIFFSPKTSRFMERL
jgi:hypothetical protein